VTADAHRTVRARRSIGLPIAIGADTNIGRAVGAGIEDLRRNVDRRRDVEGMVLGNVTNIDDVTNILGDVGNIGADLANILATQLIDDIDDVDDIDDIADIAPINSGVRTFAGTVAVGATVDRGIGAQPAQVVDATVKSPRATVPRCAAEGAFLDPG